MVKVLKSVERLVVALVDNMPEVCHAKRAKTAEDGRGVEVLKTARNLSMENKGLTSQMTHGNERVLRRLVVGGLRVAVVALPVLHVDSFMLV